MISLRQAFRLGAAPQVAFVGAGGKTTAMFQLARQFERPVLVTASTHLSSEQARQGDQQLVVKKELDEAAIDPKNLPPLTVITGPTNTQNRATSLSDGDLQRLSTFATEHQLPLLIEADGARQLPLKAPAEHEPAIPAFVDTVVVVAGLSALGNPLAQVTHRPELYSKLSGLPAGAIVTEDSLVKVMLHPNGGLKNIPPQARRICLLNQADSVEQQAIAQTIADKLLPEYESVLVATLQNEGEVLNAHERIAGIVLAAGGAERLGQPKQLLDWHGKPFVRQVAITALAAGLSPAIVVTGADAQKTEAALHGLEVKIARNENWKEGQSSSVKAGLAALNASVGGALFLVVDQPQLPIALIRALCDEHASSLAPIVAPMVDGQRSNPVLFDRSTFADFAAIEGDVGGRAIFSKHPVTWVPWLDVTLAIDVDTMEDYERLLRQTK